MFYVFFIKTDKGFDKATFENQMSVMRGQVRLHYNIICHNFSGFCICIGEKKAPVQLKDS